MAEPLSSAGGIAAAKYYFVKDVLPMLSIIGGAIAHVLEERRVHGWKGWVDALSSGFVAFFAGTIVYSFALHWYPEYAGGIAGLGGFFGTKSLMLLLRVLKTFIKETKI